MVNCVDETKEKLCLFVPLVILPFLGKAKISYFASEAAVNAAEETKFQSKTGKSRYAGHRT